MGFILAEGTKVDVFTDFLNSTNIIEIPTILARMFVALIVALFIYFIYKLTFSGVTFNRNFGGTIVITTLVTAVIMMIIGSNLALSLGMVGALSIIRFRNAVKDSRDISFIFWSVASGLAAGTGMYFIALLGTLFIGICAVVFNLTGFTVKTYLLIIKGDKSQDSEMIGKALNHYTKKYRMRMKNTSNDISESIYEIQFKKGVDAVFVEKISRIQGILSVNLVSSNDEI